MGSHGSAPVASERHRPDPRLLVSAAKQRVQRDPRDAIAWSDLARRYVALGQNLKAEKSLKVARSLAPDSRYLLRSSARFYVHIGQPDRSLALLMASPRHKTDPWLLASSLATTALLGQKVGLSRAAKSVLDSGNFRPIELTELRSEFATLQLAAGQDRRARKFFRDSLAEPNDNTLAQAEWASKEARLDLELEGYSVPFAAEAHAKSAASSSNWEAALDLSIDWLDDEPFDARAAAFGSYVAATGLEDWQSCVSLSEAGLVANPDDPLLLNNLAFGLAELGDLERSLLVLSRAERSHPSAELVPALKATAGLLSFRSGNSALGRSQYLDAIRLARAEGQAVTLLAMSMLLREEALAGVQLDAETFAEAERIRQAVPDSPATVEVFDRVAQAKFQAPTNAVDLVISTHEMLFRSSELGFRSDGSAGLELSESADPDE